MHSVTTTFGDHAVEPNVGSAAQDMKEYYVFCIFGNLAFGFGYFVLGKLRCENIDKQFGNKATTAKDPGITRKMLRSYYRTSRKKRRKSRR